MNESLFRSITGDDATHARWLNTFSYLEYVGFRKIIKSQPSSQMNLSLLEHAVEEGRHALRLKKLAIKIGGPTFENYAEETTICLNEAASYFQSLDQACSELFEMTDERHLNYLYVTWLVELRAIGIYEDYTRATNSATLRSLIGEEMNHLSDVKLRLAHADANFQANSKKLIPIEEALYRRFSSALENELLHA